MAVDNVSNNVTSSTNNQVDNDDYGDVDITRTDSGDTDTHATTIKGLSSSQEITDYINKNIIDVFKSKNPPDLAGSDRAVLALISSLGSTDPELAAITYHAADSSVNLKIEDQDLEGKRKIILGSSIKIIPDDVFEQIAKASNDKQNYADSYFNKSSSLTETESSKTETESSKTETESSKTETESSSETETLSETESSSENDATVLDLPEGIADFLPEGVSLSELDETLVIDSKTGEKVNPKKYDLDDPEEAEEYQEILERSITIQTNGKGEAVADDENIQKIANGLKEYITSPYDTKISEDALDEILGNFNIEILSEIFNLVQDDIINSGNQADIRKLKNFKDKAGDSGLDGQIGDIVEYNYLGGNTGNPTLFLVDVFDNDPSQKLQTVSIDKISDVLSEHLKDYLDTPEDERDKRAFNFIAQTISLLSSSNPDNVEQGNIDKLLQKVAEKTGDDPQVKEILSDLASDAGVDSFSEVSIQTGQTLVSNLGEFTYTDDQGNEKTFTSKDTTGSFTTFATDIVGLLTGDSASFGQGDDYDIDSQAIVASQAADAIALLSKEQQKEIIKMLNEKGINVVDELKTLASFSDDPSSNLNKLVKQVETTEDIEEITAATTVPAKATIFSDIIASFTDPTSITEIQELIDVITEGTNPPSFLELDATTYPQFTAALKEQLANTEGANPDLIIDNLNQSLTRKGIKFNTTDGTEYNAGTLATDNTIYLDKIEAGSLTPEDATAFLASLTDAEKADPAFWTEIFADRTFATEAEYNKFRDSILNLLTAVGSADPATDPTVKTALTTALLTNTPDLTYAPTENTYLELFSGSLEGDTTDGSDNGEKTRFKALDAKLISSDAGYIEFLSGKPDSVDTQGIIANIKSELTSDTTALTAFEAALNTQKESTLATDFQKALQDSKGNFDTAITNLGVNIARNGNSTETFDALNTAVVSYVLTLPENERTDKLIELIDVIADKLDEGSKNTTSEELKKWANNLGQKVNSLDVNDTIDTEKIRSHIQGSGLYGEKAGVGKNADDRRFDVSERFKFAANGETDPNYAPPTE